MVTVSPKSPIDKLPVGPLQTESNDALEGAALGRQSQNQDAPSRTQLNLWRHRILTLLFIFFCATVGVLLVILPWRPEWTDNHFLLGSPGLRAFVSNGFVRGLCSGLGLLDIWIGFWEAVHYREPSLH